MPNPLYAAVVLLIAISGPAHAGDTDDWPDDDDTKADDTKDVPTGVDLLDGEDTTPHQGAGQDSEQIYRAESERLKGFEPDEELAEWEAYLEKYPDSLFKERIEKREEDLQDAMYAHHPTDDGKDAKDEEVHLAVPLQLDNINPRRMMQAGFEWGLPDYINLFVDYEHPFRRDLAAHFGVRHRYTGWRLETGVKYAFIKSTRTQTVGSLLFDLHLNTLPAYPVLRPQIAIGHKFGDILDAQAQAGVEVDTRSRAGIRPIGGVNLTFNASDTVKVFVESAVYMQSLKSPKGDLFYRFNTVNFGMKFLPSGKGIEPGQVEVNLGASMPYTSNYWSFHYGSIMGQLNYYFK